jgi:hypothetical protein
VLMESLLYQFYFLDIWSTRRVYCLMKIFLEFELSCLCGLL